MELICVSLARVVAFLEVIGIDPKGVTSVSESLASLTERYKFEKTPQSISELDFQKGVELVAGRLDSIRIYKVTLYANAVSVDTHSSTDECDIVLDDLLEWAQQFAGGILIPNRKGYVSNLVVKSNVDLGRMNRVLGEIAGIVSSVVSSGLGQDFRFEATSVFIGCDHTQTKLTPIAFSIDRRSETPFWDNTYYSAAPVSTNVHLDLIGKFEEALVMRPHQEMIDGPEAMALI